MAYRDYVNELVGYVPRLSPLNADKLINRAWRMIQDMRLWSFNVVSDGQLFLPTAITAGRVTAVFNTTTMQADATAIAALNVVALSNPLLASATLGNGRQIRLGAPAGPIYNIVGYDTGTGIINIDRPYGEASTALSTYQVYKAFYAPPLTQGSPSPTFVRYFSIVNNANGYSIRGKKLYYSQAQINAIDPQRGATGDPYIVAFKSPNSLGQPVHELYPNPVNFRNLTCTFQVKQPSLSPTVDLPQMPYSLADMVTFLAKKLAAEWALANVGTYPELGSVNWVAAAGMQDKEFKEARIQCLKQDDEIAPLLAKLVSSTFEFPLGGQFLQSHDISSIVP